MGILKIYMASDKEKTYDDYLYGITSNKKFIIFQCALVFIAAIVAFIIAKFNYIMVVPIAFSIYNMIYVYLNVKKAEYLLNKKTPKYQVQYYSEVFFYYLKLMEEKMLENNLKTSEIKNWKDYYLKSFKSDLSLRNFKQTVEKLESHIGNILNDNSFTLNEKEFKKFKKKEFEEYRENHFPELNELIKENKINIKSKEQAFAMAGFNNDAVSKNLKLLGLSNNTKNFQIVTIRYYELVKMYHPDRVKTEDSQRKLAEINKAYAEIKKYFKANGFKV